MYSGSDSTDSQKYPQWALNPSTYQNMSNEQVDWAALAQQWIIMKEAGPPPVIPSTNDKSKPKKEQLNEGGEAPMDVEDKEDSVEWNQSDWSWNAQNQAWGWMPPTGVPPPVPIKTPLLPTPGNYETTMKCVRYSSAPPGDYTSGYWTSAGSSKQIKPHNRRFSKVNVPRPAQPLISETQPTLDASKRKQLPAWIREGLEKMERDKQKQMEREKEKQEQEEYNEKVKQNEKETMEILKSTIKEQQRSKFESDGEDSGDNTEAPVEPIVLTPAEQMMNVRRTMTEILLKVTNREIDTICREELQRYHKKNKASDQRVSAPSGANVTAKLGLGIYGDSNSSSSDESDAGTPQDRKDSDAELKENIKRKKAEFMKTEREIGEKLAEAEGRVARTPSPEINNDTQVDTKSQGRKKRAKSRTPSSSSSSSSSSDRDSKKTKRRKRSRSSTPEKRPRKTKRSRSRSRGRYRRSRSPSYRRRRRSRSRSPYSRRMTKSRSRSRSSGRGKRSRRR